MWRYLYRSTLVEEETLAAHINCSTWANVTKSTLVGSPHGLKLSWYWYFTGNGYLDVYETWSKLLLLMRNWWCVMRAINWAPVCTCMKYRKYITYLCLWRLSLYIHCLRAMRFFAMNECLKSQQIWDITDNYIHVQIWMWLCIVPWFPAQS